MDRLRQVLRTIGKSLSELSGSGRAAVILGMAVLALALVLVAQWSSKSAYVELMPGAPQESQREAAVRAEMMGIRTGLRDGNLTVPAEKREMLLGVLGDAGKLPDDTTVLFSNLASKTNWMNSRSENDRQFNLALQNELSRVIANFPSIARATVVMDVPEPIGMGAAYRRPSASVTVGTRNGRSLTQQTVDAIAAMVAGARAGLRPEDVRVIDMTSQRQFRVRGDAGFDAGDYMEHVAKIEDRVQGKLLESLRYIRGVIVAVNAHADVRKTTISETKMLPEKAGSVAIVSKETGKEQTTASGSTAGESGVRSNVQADIAGGGGGGTSQSDTQTETEFKVSIGQRQENTVDPRGMPTKLNVMINLPREYISDLVRIEKNDPKAEVTQAEVDQRFAAERDRIAKDVQPLVETLAATTGEGVPPTQAGTVVVSMRSVGGVDGGGGASAAGLGGAGGSGVMGTVTELVTGGAVKTALLLGLAAGALGMMFMLVRKAAKPVELPSAQEIVGVPPALEAGADIVGEADEGATAMEGIELPDQQVRVKKMLETIGDMVKNKPQDAAGLLNRWLQVEG